MAWLCSPFLKSIQGTHDAGNCWYKLISGRFLEIGMICNTFDHGIFLWDWNNECSYLVTETDDVLMASITCSPFLFLQQELKKMFESTCREGNVLRFLNLHIIQSPISGISIDQTQHITSTILGEYFKDVQPSSISFKPILFHLSQHLNVHSMKLPLSLFLPSRLKKKNLGSLSPTLLVA